MHSQTKPRPFLDQCQSSVHHPSGSLEATNLQLVAVAVCLVYIPDSSSLVLLGLWFDAHIRSHNLAHNILYFLVCQKFLPTLTVLLDLRYYVVPHHVSRSSTISITPNISNNQATYATSTYHCTSPYRTFLHLHDLLATSIHSFCILHYRNPASFWTQAA